MLIGVPTCPTQRRHRRGDVTQWKQKVEAQYEESKGDAALTPPIHGGSVFDAC